MGSSRVRHGAAGGPQGVAPWSVLDRGRVARDEGGDGDDPLIGGAGADALIGGPGRDSRGGGPGANAVIPDRASRRGGGGGGAPGGDPRAAPPGARPRARRAPLRPCGRAAGGGWLLRGGGPTR